MHWYYGSGAVLKKKIVKMWLILPHPSSPKFQRSGFPNGNIIKKSTIEIICCMKF